MRSRPLAILICVVILLTSLFVVTSSAGSSENLIEPDLRQWDNIGLDDFVSTKKGNIYRLSSSVTSEGYFLGVVVDFPSFVAGHSYSFKFRLPSSSEISSAWGIDYTTSMIINHYNDSTITVGYGFLNATGTAIDNQVNLFQFNSDNIADYIGKDLSTSFVSGASSGRPVIFISLYSTDGNAHHYFFSDFVLIDNDDNSGDIKGILGVLHYLRWDTFGGVCDNEDCSHSTSINPHTSLTQRMSEGFANFFNNLASKFEKGSTLNTWFTNLASGVTDLGSDVNGWLSGLGNKINSKLGDVLSGLTSKLTDLGVDIGGFIDGVSSLIDNLFGTLFDWIETFKPRVYERFRWRPGNISSSTGEVILKEEGYPYAIVTDFFTVEPGTKVCLNFEPTSDVSSLSVFQYDYYGNFVSVKLTTSSVLDKYELTPGFLYRFRVIYSCDDIQLSHINQYVRVYADEGWIMSFIHSIESFGTGCINMVLYFDWYGDYKNPFVEDLPFVSFIRSFFVSLTDFIENSLTNYLEFKVKSHAFNILFSYVLEEIPILAFIGVASLFLVVVSRFIGI